MLMTSEKLYRMAIANGDVWEFRFDAELVDWGRELTRILQLTSQGDVSGAQRLVFQTMTEDERKANADRALRNYGCLQVFQDHEPRTLRCYIDHCDHHAQVAVINMWNVLNVMYEQALQTGGLPFHAALVERHGRGVALAAPGGTGKSTCARRIPPPWTALCDDETLIVPIRASGPTPDPSQEGTSAASLLKRMGDESGLRYVAHPYPTWSDYLNGESSRTWPVETAVPLTAICFITQAATDAITPLNPGEAAQSTVDAAMQTGRRMWRRLQKDQQTALKTRLFHNACDLARRVPAYRLHVSLHGRFWEELERGLERGN
jgi:hypothetical protein